ncbi:MAG: hypothetical protein HYT12_01760, partial [Candidatus Liptonbacteria bacterium]|nr:hypothetical protein [Candidatus Liptonbacteria bacterium]
MIFFDAKKLALMELITSTGIFLIVLLIFFFGMTKLDVYQIGWFKAPVDPALFFLPFGPILFSLAGRSAIPSVLEDLRSRNIPEFLASRVIFYGTVLPAAVYIFFIIGIFGLSGEVSEDAVTGIVKTGKPLLAPLGILGLVALLSTYAPLAVSVKNIL